MLLFILIQTQSEHKKKNNFNTSHVTVYPTRSERQIQQRAISIHLMLLFIEVEKMHEITKDSFQYISCYCLSTFPSFSKTSISISIHLMLLFIGGKNKAFRFVPRFQYISCYCLSSLATGRKHLKDISIHLMLLLITGVVPEGEEVTKFSIHLMLLFIRISSALINFKIDFNTSHVTVYRRENILKDALNEFQYISCYCLSR